MNQTKPWPNRKSHNNRNNSHPSLHCAPTTRADVVPGIVTNIRIVEPGRALSLPARKAVLQGSHLMPDLTEKVCLRLRKEEGLTAVPFGGKQGSSNLLVATTQPISLYTIQEDEWEIRAVDSGEAMTLTVNTPAHQDLIVQLVERALTDTIAHRTNRWTLDSFRNWYERHPFIVEQGIAAYRRVSVSATMVEGEGIGVAADVQTAFFTEESIAWFFDKRPNGTEQERRQSLAKRLMRRQDGQKGTLLYDCGRRGFSKCYFEQPPVGKTCATTGIIRAKGKTYESLWHYYREHVDLPPEK